jgi:predicted nucleic acid-binding Zn ribbon protein
VPLGSHIEGNEMTSRQIELAKKKAAIVEACMSGLPQTLVAEKFKCTRQYIHIVLLNMNLLERYAEKRKEVRISKLNAEYRQWVESRYDPNVKCVVCGKAARLTTGYPKKVRTCSAECSKVWKKDRYKFSSEIRKKFRMIQAKAGMLNS